MHRYHFQYDAFCCCYCCFVLLAQKRFEFSFNSFYSARYDTIRIKRNIVDPDSSSFLLLLSHRHQKNTLNIAIFYLFFFSVSAVCMLIVIIATIFSFKKIIQAWCSGKVFLTSLLFSSFLAFTSISSISASIHKVTWSVTSSKVNFNSVKKWIFPFLSF